MKPFGVCGKGVFYDFNVKECPIVFDIFILQLMVVASAYAYSSSDSDRGKLERRRKDARYGRALRKEFIAMVFLTSQIRLDYTACIRLEICGRKISSIARWVTQHILRHPLSMQIRHPLYTTIYLGARSNNDLQHIAFFLMSPTIYMYPIISPLPPAYLPFNQVSQALTTT